MLFRLLKIMILKSLWKNTNNGINLQYDIYHDTKEVLKAVRRENRERLAKHLPYQGAILSFLFSHFLQKLNSAWSEAQGELPKHIFNFTIQYLSNSLPPRNNLCKLNLSKTSDCSFCLIPETLLHAVVGCKVYLNQGRFTWRHGSGLNFLATSLKAINGSSLYADKPGFHLPSIITGDELRPHLLLKTDTNSL